jgi:hypothetical protein
LLSQRWASGLWLVVGEIHFLEPESGRSFLWRHGARVSAIRSFENRNLAITENHVFSLCTVNQFLLGFSGLAGQSVTGSTLADQDVGISYFSAPQQLIPQIEVIGAFELGNSASDRGQTVRNSYYFSDVLFLSRSKHNLRFGTEFLRNQFNHLSDYSRGLNILLSFPDSCSARPPGLSGQEGTAHRSRVFSYHP